MRKGTLALDPAGMSVDRSRPLVPQLHEQLKARILSGQLAAQARLPTTRALAGALGLSRNTIVRVYEQLLDEGYIKGRTGDGSYVSELHGASAHAPKPAEPMRMPDGPLWQRLQAYEPARMPEGPARAFRYGMPALDLFPAEVWSRLHARFWRHPASRTLGYSDPAGLPRLRRQVADYLSHARGLHCEPEQVIITTGSQQAISLAALALLRAGDRVATESPGYRAAAAALGLRGNAVLRVPLDEQGLRVAALEALGPCRLVYVTPSHQFPSGVTMTPSRRLELLDWARRHDAYVIEDDYDGEYRYTGVPLAPLAALDASGRTLYVGTFSKLLFPGLRLGYLLAPPGWAETLARLRAVLDRHSGIADQHVLADFIEQGHFLRHVRRVRRAALTRRDALLDCWQRTFGQALPLCPVAAGLHALLPLESPTQEALHLRLAEQQGIELGALRQIGAVPAASQLAGLVLGFAPVPEAQIRSAVQTLARAWRKA